jgi:hypothetical protein
VVAGLFAAQPLYLDDFSTHAGKDLGAAGACLMPAKVNNADAVQRIFSLWHMYHS